MTKIIFQDTSSNYNSKNLKAVVKIDDDNIVTADLYYNNEYIERKNSYGVTMRDLTGTYAIVLNCSAMRRDGTFFVGGLGKSQEMAKGFKRRTLKDLQKIADELDDAGIVAAAQGDSKPTLIVGGKI